MDKLYYNSFIIQKKPNKKLDSRLRGNDDTKSTITNLQNRHSGLELDSRLRGKDDTKSTITNLQNRHSGLDPESREVPYLGC